MFKRFLDIFSYSVLLHFLHKMTDRESIHDKDACAENNSEKVACDNFWHTLNTRLAFKFQRTFEFGLSGFGPLGRSDLDDIENLLLTRAMKKFVPTNFDFKTLYMVPFTTQVKVSHFYAATKLKVERFLKTRAALNLYKIS